ncbi:MAG: hypothetical protein HY059_22820 [Proteobacteria bacterium]|nr:hypothetical protein [Pseudomonadota bacterium]
MKLTPLAASALVLLASSVHAKPRLNGPAFEQAAAQSGTRTPVSSQPETQTAPAAAAVTQTPPEPPADSAYGRFKAGFGPASTEPLDARALTGWFGGEMATIDAPNQVGAVLFAGAMDGGAFKFAGPMTAGPNERALTPQFLAEMRRRLAGDLANFKPTVFSNQGAKTSLSLRISIDLGVAQIDTELEMNTTVRKKGANLWVAVSDKNGAPVAFGRLNATPLPAP